MLAIYVYGKGACHMGKCYGATRRTEYQRSPVDMRRANTEMHGVSKITQEKI